MAVKDKKTGNVVTDILVCLANGKNYTEALAEIGSKWQISERTFNRKWKEAKETHRENQEALRMQIADHVIKANADALQSGLIAREGRLKILSDMANGLPLVRKNINGTETHVFPSVTEQQRAIDMLTRMGEGYSPVKKDFQIDSNRDFEINIVD